MSQSLGEGAYGLLIPFVFIYLSCSERWGLSGPRNRPSLFGPVSHGSSAPPLPSGAALRLIVRSISITADQSGDFCLRRSPKELFNSSYKVHAKRLSVPPTPTPTQPPASHYRMVLAKPGQVQAGVCVLVERWLTSRRSAGSHGPPCGPRHLYSAAEIPPEGAKSSFWSPKVKANVSSKVCALAHFLMLC